MQTSLDRLKSGVTARVTGFSEPHDVAVDRLVEMGFDEGAEVEVLHRAPLGDPLAVRVDGSTVAMRLILAQRILVEDKI